MITVTTVSLSQNKMLLNNKRLYRLPLTMWHCKVMLMRMCKLYWNCGNAGLTVPKLTVIQIVTILLKYHIVLGYLFSGTAKLQTFDGPPSREHCWSKVTTNSGKSE